MARTAFLGRLSIDLVLNTASFDKSLLRTQKQLVQTTKSLRGFSRMAKTAFIGVGVGSALAINELAKFDTAIVESSAIFTDMTGSMSKEMRILAKQLSQVSKFSAPELAQAFFFLGSAGLSVEQSMKALPAIVQFAQAGVISLKRGTELLADAQASLGLTSKDATQNLANLVRISDVLVKANTLSQATTEQFAIAIANRAGNAARTLGMSLEDLVTGLAVFAKQGIKGRLAGSRMAIFLTNLASIATKNADEFKKLGISVFDTFGNMRGIVPIIAQLDKALTGMSTQQKIAALTALGFSDRSRISAQALLGMTQIARKYNEELKNSAGITGEIANKQMQALGNQIKVLKNRFQTFIITLTEQFEPEIRSALDLFQKLFSTKSAKVWADFLRSSFNAIAKTIQNMSTFLMPILKGLAETAITAFSSFLTGLSEISDALGKLVKDIEKVKKAGEILGASFKGIYWHTVGATDPDNPFKPENINKRNRQQRADDWLERLPMPGKPLRKEKTLGDRLREMQKSFTDLIKIQKDLVKRWREGIFEDLSIQVDTPRTQAQRPLTPAEMELQRLLDKQSQISKGVTAETSSTGALIRGSVEEFKARMQGVTPQDKQVQSTDRLTTRIEYLTRVIEEEARQRQIDRSLIEQTRRSYMGYEGVLA